MRLTATDKATSQSVATLDVVLPVSDETTCRDCHATGAAAAKSAGVTWSTSADVEIQSRENVLLLHDSRIGTRLMASKPVLCAGCHYSAALDLAGTGPAGSQVGRPTMSAAMHAYHADKMLTTSGAPLSDHYVAQGGTPPSPETQACYLPSRQDDAVPARRDDGRRHLPELPRQHERRRRPDRPRDWRQHRRSERRQGASPWIDLPRCQSCHTGDASSHLTLADATPDGQRRHAHAGRVRHGRCGGLAAQGDEQPLRRERRTRCSATARATAASPARAATTARTRSGRTRSTCTTTTWPRSSCRATRARSRSARPATVPARCRCRWAGRTACTSSPTRAGRRGNHGSLAEAGQAGLRGLPWHGLPRIGAFAHGRAARLGITHRGEGDGGRLLRLPQWPERWRLSPSTRRRVRR